MRDIINIWLHRYFGDEEAILLAMIILTSLVLIWFLGDVLAPFIVALILAYILQGLVKTLTGWKMNRRWAVAITFTTFIGLIVSLSLFIVPLVLAQVAAVVSDLPQILGRGEALLTATAEKYSGTVSEALLQQVFSELNQFAVSRGEELLSNSLGSIPGIFTLIIYATLVFLLVFFLLKDWQELARGAKGFLPTRRGAMRLIWAEMDEQLANYLRGKALEILIVAVASYIVFMLFGLRYSLLLALLVGFSVLIPFVGAFAVTIPVGLVAIFQWGLEAQAFYLIMAYIVLQILDGNVLVPLLFSEAVNLHPVYIILAILVFGGIWGLWGIFFAIPLATFIKAVVCAWPVSPIVNDAPLAVSGE